MRWIDTLIDSRRAFFCLLAGYFSLQIVLRLFMPDSLDLDEAEQMFQSQWWMLGYGPQPPLYNWIQQFFFTVFGHQVLALTLFKNLLLFSTWSLVYLVAQRVLGSYRLAALVTLSLIFIPQISWESQRDLTHSVLVTTLAILTLYQGLRLFENPALKNFLLFGLVVGLGCNAKYSYLLFVVALGLAALSLEDIRKQLWRPTLVLSALLAIAVCLPHWWWMAGNLDLASDSTLSKLMRPAEQSFLTLRLEGLLSLVTASTQFIVLFVLIFAAFFLRPGSGNGGQRSVVERLILRYLLALLELFLVFILATGVNFIKDRWMQPLLLVTPLAAFLIWGRSSLAAHRGYATVALLFMALIPLLLVVRVTAVDLTGRPERLNLPYSEFVAQGFPNESPALVVTERVRTAGNVKLQIPSATVLTAERPDLGDWVVPETGEVWVIWDATGLERIPDSLADAVSRLQPAMRIAGIRYLDIPYHYSENQQASFALALLIPGEE